MKGAWGMAKDQLTGDSADDNYDPKLSPLQAFTNSSKLTANQSVDHLEAFVESMATLGGMALGGLDGAVGAKFVGALGETGNKYGLRPASTFDVSRRWRNPLHRPIPAQTFTWTTATL